MSQVLEITAFLEKLFLYEQRTIATYLVKKGNLVRFNQVFLSNERMIQRLVCSESNGNNLVNNNTSAYMDLFV